ncbi:MAG: DUF2007 domain-containing protein [Candidatus Cloacimonetes bacterium]|nr:DUF2007 domain-containing protein [Candidatus Cloacimonadota bacterium]
MFCPKCKAEYIKGVTECPECKVPLIKKLPSEEFIEFVKVFESPNPALTAIIKSILDDAKIKYFVKGEHMQGLFGGRMQFTSKAGIGNAEFFVSKEDEEIAKELLREVEDNSNQE